MSDSSTTANAADDYGFADLAPGVDLRGLDGLQREALYFLLTLGNVTVAAKSIGLERKSVLYWMRQNSLFVAAFKAARERLIAANEKRMAALAAGGPQAVEEAFTSDERETPLAVLRLLRLI